MRRRTFAGLGGTVVIVLGLGWLLSLATTRVVNWFVMTDELYYERLAVAVAQTSSLLPRIHGELVANVNQLYPVLVSLVYGNGNVPASLHDAHRLNAFLIVSAAIPVYLLARVVGLRLVASLWVALVAAGVPWVVLASFLLTEVVAYPAFCWAVLAITSAVQRRAAATDLLALAAIALAVLARVQFALLALVFVLAVVWDALLGQAAAGRRGRALLRAAAGDLGRSRRPLALVTGVGLVLVLGAAFTGGVSRLLGAYSVTASGVRIDAELVKLVFQHAATLAFGLAILPFLVGVGWLVDRARPAVPDRQRSFALVGLLALLLLVLQVSSFDQRFGAGIVKDRYLFYAVPIVLVALAATVDRGPWPRWWALLVPALVSVAGFATLPLPRYVKLNIDSPLAMLHDGLIRLSTSAGWGRALLVLSVVVGVQLLLMGRLVLPGRAVALAVAVVASAVLPLETVYAFERLFRVDGTNGLPVTLDQGVVFSWVDRNVGRTGRVLMVKYPVNGTDWWAGQAYWWDAEFWNESVVDSFGDPRNDWRPRFDARTGALEGEDRTDFSLVHTSDVRFRFAGTQVAFDRDSYIFRTERPLRAAWLTDGIYADGWMRPHVPARITVFADPGQKSPLRRFVTLTLSSSDRELAWPVTISTSFARFRERVPPESSLDKLVSVCVPAGGTGEVVIRTPLVASVYRDPTKAALTGEVDRPAGLHLRTVALADETEPVQRCPGEEVVR